MYSTMPELTANPSFLEKPSFNKYFWLAETRERWNISPEGKNNEMHFPQEREIGLDEKSRGTKSRW